MKVQKAGFQNREDGANFRKEETPVYVVGTRVPDFPNSLHIRFRISYGSLLIVIKVRFLNYLIEERKWADELRTII
ncbi:hypothetical protein NV377_14470 [Paenibacillus sp. T3-5-0-4]|nr:hypothetical protein [Paenibacillus endoradicis]